MANSDGRPKIWVSAGPFGFGPAAIAFNLFPQLKKLVTSDGGQTPLLEYVGSGLAMDFNAALPWDAVHEVNVHEAGGGDKLADLYRARSPALAISVLDIPFAEAIVPQGAKVVIIDSLLWYWESIFPIYKDITLLLVPDFIGVRDRIKENKLDNAVILPGMLPLAPGADDEDLSTPHERKGTLINLGGLQTPFSALAENVKYTRCMLQALQAAVQQRNNAADAPLTALVSDKVARALQPEFPFVQTVDPRTARRALRSCRTAFLTSGMGNLFDVVDVGHRVAFLPAICKSHGLQLELLAQIGARPTVIDWQDVVAGRARLDYSADDAACFAQVEDVQREFLGSAEAQANLAQQFVAVLEGDGENTSSLQCIPRVLGRADADLFAKCIAERDLGFRFDD